MPRQFQKSPNFSVTTLFLNAFLGFREKGKNFLAFARRRAAPLEHNTPAVFFAAAARAGNISLFPYTPLYSSFKRKKSLKTRWLQKAGSKNCQEKRRENAGKTQGKRRGKVSDL